MTRTTTTTTESGGDNNYSEVDDDFSVLFHWIYCRLHFNVFSKIRWWFWNLSCQRRRIFLLLILILFFGPRASTYRLVLRVFVFKEIWLKLNYVKIFRQHFCILYIHVYYSVHIFWKWRDNIISTLYPLSAHIGIAFFPMTFTYLFCIWFLSTEDKKIRLKHMHSSSTGVLALEFVCRRFICTPKLSENPKRNR